MACNSAAKPAPMHIICYGNEWQGDDGFGMHVYHRLRRTPFFRTIPVFEGGIGGLSTITCFENCQKAIIVDSVRSGAECGTLVILNPQDLALKDGLFTLHNYGVGHLLACLQLLFERDALQPEIFFIGAEIGTREAIGFGNTLSPPLDCAVSQAVRVIKKMAVL